MTGVEIILILIGIVFMVGSFMVTEKLSPSELDGIAKMSESEIKIIVDREMRNASEQISEQIDGAIDASIDKVERSMDRETNEKILAISEYSDTVLENMNKTHNEIMFLYSMLNDKHTELTELSGELSKVAAKVEEQLDHSGEREEKSEEKKEVATESIPAEADADESAEMAVNHNERILELYGQGKSYMDIARELGLGLGEVKLVVDLFKGES